MPQDDGKSYRVLTEEEYLREWEPIRARIFDDRVDFTGVVPTRRPFAREDWRIVALAGDLYNDNFLFQTEAVADQDKRESSWADDGELLFAALRQWGVTEMALTARPFGNCPRSDAQTDAAIDYCDAVLCRPTVESVFEVLFDAAPFLGEGLWVFSRQGDWGLLSIHDPWLRLLAGSADFMDAYLAQAGGLEAVQERFHYMDVADSEFSWMPRETKDAFYRMLGWEPLKPTLNPRADRDAITEWGMRLGRAHPKYMGPYKD